MQVSRVTYFSVCTLFAYSTFLLSGDWLIKGDKKGQNPAGTREIAEINTKMWKTVVRNTSC